MGFLKRLLEEPPPGWAFEISPLALVAARVNGTPEVTARPLERDVLLLSPVEDNILRRDLLSDHIRALAPLKSEERRRRKAALILPDLSVRLSVVEFESFPPDSAEQLQLLKYRLRKTVPFDIESASITYHVQSRAKPVSLVVAVAPASVIAGYEAPFRALGFQPGYITTSMLAALNLAPATGITVVAKQTGRVLSVAALDGPLVKLLRAIELAEGGIEEVVEELYPTFAFVEDELGARFDRLLLCGFGQETDGLVTRFSLEFGGVQVEPLRSRGGQRAEQHDAGVLGYLDSLVQ